MATNEEEVRRFGLRRGARFLETLREEAESQDADDEWIAGLRPDSADEAAIGAVDSDEGPARGPAGSDHEAPEVRAPAEPVAPTAPVAHAPPAGVLDIVPALGDAMATLEERLSVLEEALVKAAAACTVTRMVLRQAEPARGDSSRPSVPSPPEEPEP